MIKYVDANDSKKTREHWDYCEQNHFPFITIERINKDMFEVFYDITNSKYDLDEISNQIKSIFLSYSTFFLIPYYDYQSYMEQLYFFRIPVKEGHQQQFAEQLFNWLLEKIKG